LAEFQLRNNKQPWWHYLDSIPLFKFSYGGRSGNRASRLVAAGPVNYQSAFWFMHHHSFITKRKAGIVVSVIYGQSNFIII